MYYIFTKNDFTDIEQKNIKLALTILVTKVASLNSTVSNDILNTICFVFTKQTERLEYLEELNNINATITPLITSVGRIYEQREIQELAQLLFDRVQSIDDDDSISCIFKAK